MAATERLPVGFFNIPFGIVEYVVLISIVLIFLEN